MPMKSLHYIARTALAGTIGGLIGALFADLFGIAGSGAYILFPAAGLVGGSLGGWIRLRRDRRH